MPHNGVRVVLLALLLAACGEGGAEGPVGPRDSVPPPPAPRLLASAPVPRTLLGQADGETVAYVSAPTGLLVRGALAAVVNQRTGERRLTPLAAGGFDPVALVAADGDVVEVTVTDIAGQANTTPVTVKRGTRPRVVRTAPEPRATDVPLNSVIRVVFTTPVTREAAAAAVRLLQRGVAVAGAVRVVGEADVVVDFTPAVPLAANTDYELRVDASLRDVLGQALESEVVVPFATGATAAAPPPLEPLTNEIVFSSPDPTRFLSETYGMPSNLFAIREDGTGLTRLTNSGTSIYVQPSVARDGRIVFVIDHASLAVRERDGTVHPLAPGTPSPVPAARCPAWSPDMRHVAYQSVEPAGGLSIRVVRADGSGAIVAEIDAPTTCPSWLPDGTGLSYGTWTWGEYRVRLAVADVARFPAVRTRESATRVATLFGRWSPAGDALVSVVEELGSLWLERTPLDGGDGPRLAQMPAIDCCFVLGTPYVPDWSPDGRLMVVNLGDGGISLVDPTVGSIKQLPTTGDHPAFAPAGVSFTR